MDTLEIKNKDIQSITNNKEKLSEPNTSASHSAVNSWFAIICNLKNKVNPETQININPNSNESL
jgi:hypothetical protein